MLTGSFTADIIAISAAARPQTAEYADDIVDLPGA
jgi:hypothetical protein